MFAAWCPRHASTVLLDARRVRALVDDGEGHIIVELECWDGERIRLLTGRATQGEAATLTG